MKRIFQFAGFLSAILLLVSCGEKETTPNKERKEKIKYATMILTPRHISSNVQLPGVLHPFEVVEIYPKVSGFIRSVAVDRGSVVKRGQLLVSLEAPEIEQQVAAAKLRYSQAQASYLASRDRYQRLLEASLTPGAISPYDLQAAESKEEGDSATAQGEYANYKAQESMRNYLTVNSPFDGVITERNVHPGALAGPGAQNAKPMLILQQLSKLRLVVEIPEQYAVQVKDGDTVHYRLNALPGQEFEGVISRSSQSLSNNYRSETIEIDVLNPKNTFKPGMYAEVVLPTSGSANAFVVPRTAVVTTTERKYVISDIGNEARWIDVTEGNQNNDSTEVFGKLFPNDEIVTNAGYQLKEGMEIR